MKPSIFVLAVAVTLTLGSCTTAYKTGQTPDDVYFSPVRSQDEYVTINQREDNEYRGNDYYGDRYIRMRMLNRNRWSVLDDYYFDNPYAYNYYGSYGNWNNPWNSYWTWNSFYNPYYGGGSVIIKNPVAYKAPSRAVVFNPNSYINNNPVPQQYNAKMGYSSPSNGSRPGNNTRYNNSNSNNSNYSRSNNNSYSGNNSNSTPSRSYNPTSNSSNSSSSSSSAGKSSSSSSSSSSGSTRPPR